MNWFGRLWSPSYNRDPPGERVGKNRRSDALPWRVAVKQGTSLVRDPCQPGRSQLAFVPRMI